MTRAAALLAALTVVAGLPATATAKRIVRYERTGGFAGLYDTVTVFSGGTTVVHRRSGTRERVLGGKRLRALKRALAHARLGSLRTRYRPARPVADGIAETVRHGGHTVTVEQGGHPPKRLARLLARLRRLMP